ncbi:NIPSNAP family protein [Nocardia wallacei]|uniref:NIPSNAP family protein n=1 Tax=Nocardia wallacei TaxID=480035 RepID=UPI002453DC31|nr:NIPSNAP family protein [Nocardia wallacei]
MFIEHYEYRVNPGMWEQWEEFMLELAVPYQQSRGMRILGLFWADDDHTRFVWMRSFESDDERDRLYAAIYESEHWQRKMLPEVRRLVVKGSSRTTRLAPFSDISALHSPL